MAVWRNTGGMRSAGPPTYMEENEKGREGIDGDRKMRHHCRQVPPHPRRRWPHSRHFSFPQGPRDHRSPLVPLRIVVQGEEGRSAKQHERKGVHHKRKGITLAIVWDLEVHGDEGGLLLFGVNVLHEAVGKEILPGPALPIGERLARRREAL